MAGTEDSAASAPEMAGAAQPGLPRQEQTTPLSDAFAELDSLEGPGAETPGAAPAAGRNIDAMLNVDLRVQVILGHARMPISQLLKLSRGAVIELDRKIGEPVEVVINDKLVARGNLVKLKGDRIGVTLTEIIKDYVLDT